MRPMRHRRNDEGARRAAEVVMRFTPSASRSCRNSGTELYDNMVGGTDT